LTRPPKTVQLQNRGCVEWYVQVQERYEYEGKRFTEKQIMAGLKEKEADVRVMEPHKANNTVDTDMPFFQVLQFSGQAN
jgi:hypothetical protein